MVLAIDAGNSTVKFGFFGEGGLGHVFRAASRPDATPDEYIAFLSAHMGRVGISKEEVMGIVISAVTPTVAVFFEALKGFFNLTPMLVSARLKLGVSIKYKTPETLGADRIAAAAGAYSGYGGPVIVADFGTASAFTVVDGSGGLLGGMIAPGLLTGYDALIEKASGLTKIGLAFPKGVIGRDTAEGIQSGVIFGHAAMAAGLIGRAREELGGKAEVVATGGLAETVAPHIGVDVRVEPHLVLRGLHEIYRLNS